MKELSLYEKQYAVILLRFSLPARPPSLNQFPYIKDHKTMVTETEVVNLPKQKTMKKTHTRWETISVYIRTMGNGWK
jgi:hypothetical protein